VSDGSGKLLYEVGNLPKRPDLAACLQILGAPSHRVALSERVEELWWNGRDSRYCVQAFTKPCHDIVRDHPAGELQEVFVYSTGLMPSGFDAGLAYVLRRDRP
ncbi:MAG TPA: hypothetical protein VGR43_00525, partial [Dehalococcoidia bacterium]|nr:hypothetical protein [Dehalococcoidia bacterium]